eukprot:1248421-Prymnesium_polylepis.2
MLCACGARAGFEDEPYGLKLRHNAAGLLSVCNTGPDSNRSQFIVTLGPNPQLDGQNVVIGRLVSGAMHLEALGALPVDSADAPARRVVIAECGAIPGASRARRAARPSEGGVEQGGGVAGLGCCRLGCCGFGHARYGYGTARAAGAHGPGAARSERRPAAACRMEPAAAAAARPQVRATRDQGRAQKGRCAGRAAHAAPRTPDESTPVRGGMLLTFWPRARFPRARQARRGAPQWRTRWRRPSSGRSGTRRPRRATRSGAPPERRRAAAAARPAARWAG